MAMAPALRGGRHGPASLASAPRIGPRRQSRASREDEQLSRTVALLSVVAVALVCGPADAAPTSGSVSVEAGSGWESNVWYTSDSVAPLDDGFMELSPSAALRVVVAPGLRLRGDWAANLRAYLQSDVGTVFFQVGGLGLSWWPLDWLRVDVTVGYDHQYASSTFGGHAISVVGEAATSFVWNSGELLVGYRAHDRFWLDAEPSRRELSHLPRLQLYQVITPWLAGFVGYQVGPREADVDGFDLFSHRVLVGAVVRPVDVLRVRDVYLFYARAFEGESAPELLHGNRLEVEVEAQPWMDVWGRWDAAVNTADDPTRDFVSHTVSVGVALRWGSDTVDLLPTSLERTLEDLPEIAARPVSVAPGGARFVVHAPHARSVAVVGEWSGWDAAQGEMAPAEDGMWQVTLPVPPGSWEFTFLVDEHQVLEPEGVEHLVDSGFGDRNGVIVIQ